MSHIVANRALMDMRTVMVGCLLAIACDKSDRSGDPPRRPDPPRVADAAVAPSAACVKKVEQLAPWLEAFELEVASHEVDFGSKLHAIDRPPAPVEQRVDNVTIKPKTIQIWDASEANRVGNEVEAKDLAARLTATRTNTEEVDEKGPDDLLRIDVDAGATWEPVVNVVAAAAQAGYARVVFAFTATSKLEQPAGVEPRTTTREAVDAARTRLEELRQQCKPWGSAVLSHKWGPTRTENAKRVAQATAAALVACDCAADPDEVRAQLWKQGRWHQAVPRVGIEVALASPTETIALAKATPWPEAAAQIVAADGKAVKVIALREAAK